MSNYTVQVVKPRLSWRGGLRYTELWTEDYHTYPQAYARMGQLDQLGYTIFLHDWGTDYGEVPEPLEPGVDATDDQWYAQISGINDRNAKGDLPF